MENPSRVARYAVSNFAVSIRSKIIYLILSVWKSSWSLEVDGGQHQMNKNYDALRTQYLRLAGFDVLRFWNHDVLQNLDAVKEEIFRVVEEKIKGRGEGNPSPPRPSP